MKRIGIVFGLSAIVAAMSLAGVETAAAGDKGSCGAKGQKKCPLQGWMDKNVQVPYEKEDLKGLAVALEKAAALAPDPKWNEGDKGWSKLAKEAAAAAKSGDFKAVKKSCKTCHKAWRKKYKSDHRTKALPKT